MRRGFPCRRMRLLLALALLSLFLAACTQPENNEPGPTTPAEPRLVGADLYVGERKVSGGG